MPVLIALIIFRTMGYLEIISIGLAIHIEEILYCTS